MWWVNYSGHLPIKQNPCKYRPVTPLQSEIPLIELIYKDANAVCSGSSHNEEVTRAKHTPLKNYRGMKTVHLGMQWPDNLSLRAGFICIKGGAHMH